MTKIYNGVRFRIYDLHGLIEPLTEFRNEAEELAIGALNAVVARKMVDAIDKAIVDGEQSATSYFDIIEKVEHRRKKAIAEGRRDPAVDYDFDLVLLPFEGSLYGMMYCEQREFRDLLLSKGFAEEYAYWDNTDRPDEISEEEWAERERVWAGVMARDPAGRPGRCGVSFTLDLEFFHPSLAEVLPHVPTRKTRARAQAERVLMNKLWVERIRDEPGGNAISKTWVLLKEVKEPENAERLVEIEASILEMLPEISHQWVVENFM